jgi:cell division septal protein FtsQ
MPPPEDRDADDGRGSRDESVVVAEAVDLDVIDLAAEDEHARAEVDAIDVIDEPPASDPGPALPGDDIEVVAEPVRAPRESRESREPRRPPVDPRIRARRIAVAREQGRKRLRVVLVGLSFVILLGTGWLVVRAPFLDVDHVVVTGVPQSRAAAIIAASGVHRRDPMLLLSAGTVEHRVDQVPGVGGAHVARDFPGTVTIHVRQLGVAVWVRNPAGGALVVGFDGRVQRTVPTPPPNTIELRGLAHVPAPGGRIPIPDVTGVLEQFPTTFAQRIGAISAANRDDVRVYLVVGGEVRLGDLRLMHSKGVVAESVLERIDCAVSYVDVSSVANPVAMPAPGAHCNA